MSSSELVKEPKTRVYVYPLPSGGALKFPPSIAEIFIQQIEINCSPGDSQRELRAVERRNELVRGLSVKERRLLAMVARAVERLSQ